jgi:hypothetical protein
VSGTEPRERAAAALGHVRHAAHEMIAAARDTLDLLDDVVSRADLGEVLNGLNHLTQSLLVRRPPPRTPPPAPAPDSPVEHISVR